MREQQQRPQRAPRNDFRPLLNRGPFHLGEGPSAGLLAKLTEAGEAWVNPIFDKRNGPITPRFEKLEYTPADTVRKLIEIAQTRKIEADNVAVGKLELELVSGKFGPFLKPTSTDAFSTASVLKSLQAAMRMESSPAKVKAGIFHHGAFGIPVDRGQVHDGLGTTHIIVVCGQPMAGFFRNEKAESVIIDLRQPIMSRSVRHERDWDSDDVRNLLIGRLPANTPKGTYGWPNVADLFARTIKPAVGNPIWDPAYWNAQGSTVETTVEVEITVEPVRTNRFAHLVKLG